MMQSSLSPEIERFYYVRHGKTSDNRDGIGSGGDRDVAITEDGAQAAAALAPLFATLRDVTSIFCSPMIRAKATAEALNAQAQRRIVYIEDLREWRVGDCTGKTDAEYTGSLSGWGFDPPNGESRQVFQSRVHGALQECFRRKPSGDTLIVAHFGVWRAVTQILDMPMEPIDNTAFIEVSRTAHGWSHRRLTLQP